MANDEHVAILKKGVDVWNEWREQAIHIKPDLSGADLTYSGLAKPRRLAARCAGIRSRHLSSCQFGPAQPDR
jgi:hypothetical protein